MVFAVIMLTCVVASALWALCTWTPFSGWLAMIFGALWLPANNGQLEGRNLITLSRTHGITQGDSVGVIGWLIAMAVLLRWARQAEPGHPRSERTGMVMLIGLAALALGAIAAYETG